jgi:uncharacterized membrane protein YdbT with pleckstrin-like domain
MIEIDQNERVLRIVRNHWFVLLSDIFLLFFFIALPLILLFAFNLLPLNALLNFDGSSTIAQGFFLIAWLFIVWMIGWMLWTNYYLDVLIITDTRIFTIEQHGFFSRTSSSFRIDRIQNTTVIQSGIIETLIGFGTIHIETAGENQKFIGKFIADPYDVKKFINEAYDNLLRGTHIAQDHDSRHALRDGRDTERYGFDHGGDKDGLWCSWKSWLEKGKA